MTGLWRPPYTPKFTIAFRHRKGSPVCDYCVTLLCRPPKHNLPQSSASLLPLSLPPSLDDYDDAVHRTSSQTRTRLRKGKEEKGGEGDRDRPTDRPSAESAVKVANLIAASRHATAATIEG